ncbi:MAG: TetR/AcrR family transcriptional regulator [Prevotellaceae bacterium]|jgi:AcrR family transcriptional regulator|nr:TetR/AcrR family transcriptional regulator [Prevotellaceae bacterium]
MVTSKEKITKVAAKMFMQHGYAGSQTTALAVTAGLSNNSGLFRHFDSKEAIYDAVVDKYLLQLQDHKINAHYENGLSLREFIDVYVDRIDMMMEYLHNELDVHYNADKPLTSENYLIFVQEACERKKTCKEQYYNATRKNVEKWKQVIRRAIDNGEIRPDTDINLNAELFEMAFFGASYLFATIQSGLQPKKLKELYYCMYNNIKKK